MNPIAADAKAATGQRRRLSSLLARSPDPETDIALLKILADVDNPRTRRLCESLRTNPARHRQPLREHFLGLELVIPTAFWDRLGVRACNALRRAGLTTWRDICGCSAAWVAAVDGAGREVVEETLRSVAAEWATAHLERWEATDPPSDGASALPIPPTEQDGPARLAIAFEQLESLSPRSNSLGPAIARGMRDETWPIAVAVRDLRHRLEALALPAELDRSLAILHRRTAALPDEKPQRKELLLRLAGYRVTADWVLGPDIEKLTAGILHAFVGTDSADLDTVAAHLSTLGIRKHLQLPWLASRPGYRIIDGRLVPMLA